MASLTKLQKITIKKLKRVGRGAGSGKGKTTGRGTKGQNARHKMSITHSHHEGGQRPLFKRLPYRRGKGNRKAGQKPLAINFEKIEGLPIKTVINTQNLIKLGILGIRDAGRAIKILGFKKTTKDFSFEVPVSKKFKPQENPENSKVKVSNLEK